MSRIGFWWLLLFCTNSLSMATAVFSPLFFFSRFLSVRLPPTLDEMLNSSFWIFLGEDFDFIDDCNKDGLNSGATARSFVALSPSEGVEGASDCCLAIITSNDSAFSMRAMNHGFSFPSKFLMLLCLRSSSSCCWISAKLNLLATLDKWSACEM